MDIYCFGDSITRGENDSERGGWVDRLKTDCISRYISKGEPEDCVFNLGIGGETTRMMRSRFKSELETRLDSAQRSLVTLAYGANDASEHAGNFLVQQEEYLQNLSLTIDEAHHLRCEVCVLTIAPVTPAVDGVRSATGKVRSNAVIALYNDALRELSRQKSIVLIDVNSEFVKHDVASLFGADGVHPNAAGHKVIYDLVRERLVHF